MPLPGRVFFPSRPARLSPACLRSFLSPLPFLGLARATCSEQKQDIGNRKEGVFWCCHALQRTYHCEGVTEPWPAVVGADNDVCTNFTTALQKKLGCGDQEPQNTCLLTQACRFLPFLWFSYLETRAKSTSSTWGTTSVLWEHAE